MDNLCHTLTGAALARAGVGRGTPLAMPTLLIAANLPDVDILAYLRDPVFALAVRRGWTHGILAVAVLPVLLGLAMLGWDRVVRRRRRPGARPARFRELALVSFVGVISHPMLDLLNTYGVRLLMPFSGRWFYGDTLFIVDPWVWAALFAGVAVSVWAQRRGGGEPAAYRAARSGLAVAGLYIAAMLAGSAVARADAWRTVTTLGLTPTRVMAAPLPLDPVRRAVLLELGESYRWALHAPGSSPRLILAQDSIPRGLTDPRVLGVLDRPEARAFLSWSRFPAARLAGTTVRLYDLRYADPDQPSWASVDLPVSLATGAITPRPPARRSSPRRRSARPPAGASAVSTGRTRCRSPA